MRFCQDSTMSFPTESDLRAIAAARAIPAVVVQAKGNGHAGTAMALAPLMHTLFQRVLRHDPADPTWAGRDLFVLSAGHASLALYVQLYLCGYGLTLDDLAEARRFGSPTPGHPELHHTAGVEMSTGPLGQGMASAVGMAIAVRREAALAGSDVLDRTVWVVAGDGDLQEGVSAEAARSEERRVGKEWRSRWARGQRRRSGREWESRQCEERDTRAERGRERGREA